MSNQSTIIFLACLYAALLATRCCAAFFAHDARAMTWIDALSFAPFFLAYDILSSRFGFWQPAGLAAIIIALGDLLVWFMKKFGKRRSERRKRGEIAP